MPRTMFVYMLASANNRSLYIGVTNNVIRRTLEHRQQKPGKHSTYCKTGKLVYWEMIVGPLAAIAREKQLKRWQREWKIALIERRNPGWVDLAAAEFGLAVWDRDR